MDIYAVVMELSKKYALQVEIARKSDLSFVERRSVNQFPAIIINGTVALKGYEAALKDLESMIIREMAKTEHLP